jgi:hypothetical protein
VSDRDAPTGEDPIASLALKLESATLTLDEPERPAPRPRVVDVGPVKRSPAPEKPRNPKLPPHPRSDKKGSPLTIHGAEEGLFVEGELIDIRDMGMREGFQMRAVVMRDERDPEAGEYGVWYSFSIRDAEEVAKHLGWPKRRVYVGIRYIERAPMDSKSKRTIWRTKIEVALLKSYDVAVNKLSDLASIERSDGLRVLVREQDVVYRMDTRGGNRGK